MVDKTLLEYGQRWSGAPPGKAHVRSLGRSGGLGQCLTQRLGLVRRAGTARSPAETGKGKGKDKGQDERAAAEAAEEKKRIDGLIEQMSRVSTKTFVEVSSVVDVDNISRYVLEFDDAKASAAAEEADTASQQVSGRSSPRGPHTTSTTSTTTTSSYFP